MACVDKPSACVVHAAIILCPDVAIMYAMHSDETLKVNVDAVNAVNAFDAVDDIDDAKCVDGDKKELGIDA